VPIQHGTKLTFQYAIALLCCVQCDIAIRCAGGRARFATNTSTHTNDIYHLRQAHAFATPHVLSTTSARVRHTTLVRHIARVRYCMHQTCSPRTRSSHHLHSPHHPRSPLSPHHTASRLRLPHVCVCLTSASASHGVAPRLGNYLVSASDDATLKIWDLVLSSFVLLFEGI
jgi:hypothetical protein